MEKLRGAVTNYQPAAHCNPLVLEELAKPIKSYARRAPETQFGNYRKTRTGRAYERHNFKQCAF